MPRMAFCLFTIHNRKCCRNPPMLYRHTDAYNERSHTHKTVLTQNKCIFTAHTHNDRISKIVLVKMLLLCSILFGWIVSSLDSLSSVLIWTNKCCHLRNDFYYSCYFDKFSLEYNRENNNIIDWIFHCLLH